MLVFIALTLLLHNIHHCKALTIETSQPHQENNVSRNTEELIKNVWIRLLRANDEKVKAATVAPSYTPEDSTSTDHAIKVDTKTSRKYIPINRNLKRRSFIPKIIPDALAGFTVTLDKPILIPKRRFTFLSEFANNKASTFVRGEGFDLRLGRYNIPYSAFYNFHINLNIQRPLYSKRGINNVYENNGVTTRLCVDGECYGNIMKFRADTSSNSKTITVNLSGHLFLQKNQYVEIVMENSLSTKVVIVNGMFSGFLQGL